MNVSNGLAESTHDSAPRRPSRQEEENETNHAPRRQTTPGDRTHLRPGILAEPGPQRSDPACGAPQGRHPSSWWQRSQLLWLTASTLPRSPSSQPQRWRRGGRRRRRYTGETRRCRRRGGRCLWNSMRCGSCRSSATQHRRTPGCASSRGCSARPPPPRSVLSPLFADQKKKGRRGGRGRFRNPFSSSFSRGACAVHTWKSRLFCESLACQFLFGVFVSPEGYKNVGLPWRRLQEWRNTHATTVSEPPPPSPSPFPLPLLLPPPWIRVRASVLKAFLKEFHTSPTLVAHGNLDIVLRSPGIWHPLVRCLSRPRSRGLESGSHLFAVCLARGVQENWIVWEMAPGVALGATVDTCSRVSVRTRVSLRSFCWMWSLMVFSASELRHFSDSVHPDVSPILGALDGQQLLIVEGSGVAGRPGV